MKAEFLIRKIVTKIDLRPAKTSLVNEYYLRAYKNNLKQEKLF